VEENRSNKMRLVMKEPIAVIRQDFNRLTELWVMGECSDEQYLENLKDSVWFDESGSPWFISPENGNWYRLSDTGPELGEPPEFLYRPAESLEAMKSRVIEEPITDRFCKYCGQRIKSDARFCRECGKALK